MPITVIRLLGTNQYLKSFDPDAREPGTTFPTGYAVWSHDLDEAMTFGHAGEAIHFYKTQSKVTPYRPDGKPNRPLTTFTVDIMPLTDALRERDLAETETKP